MHSVRVWVVFEYGLCVSGCCVREQMLCGGGLRRDADSIANASTQDCWSV